METKEIKRRGTRGITLIALVVTIVVLLILAGTAIAMLSGDDGIITNSQKARREQSHGAVREGISLAYNEWRIEINTSSRTKIASTNVVQIQELSENSQETKLDFLDYTESKGYINSDGIIDTEALIGTRQALGNGEGTNDVYKLVEKNGNYIVQYYENAENVIEIWGISSNTENTEADTEWEEILEDANANPEKYKHPDQIVSEEIGIGTDGKPVNMDKWEPTFNDYSNSYILKGDHYGGTSYEGEVIEGRIEGFIPEYVYNKEQGKFLKITDISYLFYGNTELMYAPEIPSSVTNMERTFKECTSLTQAPEIPSNVTNMYETFSGCTSLIQASEILSNVTDMSYTFSGCTSLTQAPEILGSITKMQGTFSGCTSLTQAPEIPSSVTYMNYTFSGCTSLTQAPEIPSSVTNMYGTFYECTSLTQAPEIPNSVTYIDATFSGCTSLTQAPEIPSSVTSMRSTFSGCESLTGNLIINATLGKIGRYDPWEDCLSDAAINKGCNLVLSGSCTKLQEIYETANGNPNVTIKK